jgi:hypothetical protein
VRRVGIEGALGEHAAGGAVRSRDTKEPEPNGWANGSRTHRNRVRLDDVVEQIGDAEPKQVKPSKRRKKPARYRAEQVWTWRPSSGQKWRRIGSSNSLDEARHLTTSRAWGANHAVRVVDTHTGEIVYSAVLKEASQ